MLKGRFLDPKQAEAQYDAFWNFPRDLENFPRAVCYKLSELLEFYTRANTTLSEDGVPENQRGVALMVGVHLDPESSHAYGKPTIMMVATQWIDESTGTAGQVISINNPILQEGWPVALVSPPPVKDTSYDAGSLWP